MKKYADIEVGDRVTILIYAGRGLSGTEYKPRTGRAVMLGPAGWVLNMGGTHGQPDIATSENFVEIQSKKTKRRLR